MEERFETFTVLITRISRSIKRIKADEMADFELKGPHVSCLYSVSYTHLAVYKRQGRGRRTVITAKSDEPRMRQTWERRSVSPRAAGIAGRYHIQY